MNNLGCIFLEEGLNFDGDFVSDCCIMHNDNRGLPKLLTDYKGEMIDWDKLFEIKENRVKSQMEKTIYDCEKCYNLKPYEFKHSHKISQFHFTQCRQCNCKCIYCSKEYTNGGINYDVYPIIKDLLDKNLYKSGGEATLQGGEPLLMQHFDELIQLFIDNGTHIRVHSNGIKFSQPVADALKQNTGKIVISLDCSDKEMFKKIKRVDCFDAVIENIKNYSAHNPENIIIKFIIIPGYNDNLDEIDNFLVLMKDLGIKNVALDIEYNYASVNKYADVSPHIHLLYDYFENKAKKLKLNVLIYSFLSYVKRDRTLKKYPFINFKPIYSYFVNRLYDKSKKFRYKF